MRVKVRDYGSGLDKLIENLAILKRPIFLDEANRICQEQLIETVRAIHDNADIPVILVGDNKLPDLLSPFPQVRDRTQYFLEIGECTLDDALLMSRVWATTPIAESLVAKIHSSAGGNLRRIKTALVFLDSTAKTHGWESVSEKEWENRPFSPEVSSSPATRIKKQQRRAS
jgi:DNA transposition AAA+ family ATPase